MPDAAPLDAQDPRALGGYEIVRRLGSGAQGSVYLGRAPHGQVAIKVLHGEWARDPDLRARFAQEAEAARRVDAFCTARILDARTDGAAPYIVSEYVPGPSLRDAVTTEGPYHRDRLYRLAVGTATALAAIHQAGIVHRDFKPDNVLLGPDGPRVIDFGVAKSGPHGETGGSTGYVAVGTPSYMAPEQAAGGPVGPAADLFAWAEVIVFAATGRPPFGDDTPMAVATRLISEEPDLRGVDGSLRDIVAACLARDPADRPTASEVLLRLLGHDAQVFTPSVLTEGARTAATTHAPASPEPGRRRRGRVVAAVLAATAVAAGAATGLLVFRGGGTPDRKPYGGHRTVTVAGAWRGTLSGTPLRLVAVDVAADGRTARLTSPNSRCAVSLRRDAGGAYTPATASSTCRWARRARLTTRPDGGLMLSAGGAEARLSRPTSTVPRAFAGHWHGRIHPANLTVDLELGTGGPPASGGPAATRAPARCRSGSQPGGVWCWSAPATACARAARTRSCSPAPARSGRRGAWRTGRSRRPAPPHSAAHCAAIADPRCPHPAWPQRTNRHVRPDRPDIPRRASPHLEHRRRP